MAKFQFEITHPEEETIKIEAEEGLLPDNWLELSKNTCLIPSGGSFKRRMSETEFTARGNTAFVLSGDPLGSDTQGAARFELVESGHSLDGWTWRRL